jgi:hypothetical protein
MAEPSWVKSMAIASLVLSITALPASIVGFGFLPASSDNPWSDRLLPSQEKQQPAKHPAHGISWGNFRWLGDPSAGYRDNCGINLAKQLRLVRAVIHHQLPCFGQQHDKIMH